MVGCPKGPARQTSAGQPACGAASCHLTRSRFGTARSPSAVEGIGPDELDVVGREGLRSTRTRAAGLEPDRDPPVARPLHPAVAVAGMADVVTGPPRSLGRRRPDGR